MDGPIFTPDNSDVTFAEGVVNYKLDGNKFVLKLTRGVADKEISLPITLKDDNNFYVLETPEAIFNKGEFETTVIVSYDYEAVEPGVDYDFTVSFKNSERAVSGYNKVLAKCSLPHGVKFEKKGVVLDLATAKHVAIKLTREAVKKQLRVPIILIDNNGIYSIDKSYADFRQGDNEAVIILSVDSTKIKSAMNYSAYLYFDEKYSGNEGLNFFDISGRVFDIDENFNNVGMVTTTDEYDEFNGGEFVLMQSKLDKTIYRIVDFYGIGNILEFKVKSDGASHFIPEVLKPEPKYQYGIDKIAAYFAIFKTDAIFPDEGINYNIQMRFCTDAPNIGMSGVNKDSTLRLGSKININHAMYFIQRTNSDGEDQIAVLHKDWSKIVLEVTSMN
jgi:hypothetical protein